MKKHYTEVCGYPWTTLMIDHDCKYGVCCGIDGIFLDGTDIDNIDKIWNGDKIQNLREELLGLRDLEKCYKCPLFEQVMRSKFIDTEADGRFINKKEGFDRPNNAAVVSDSKPKRLHMNITDGCNINCIMCDCKKRTKDMDIDLFENILSIFANDIDIFASTISTEPFIHSDIFSIVNIMSKYLKPETYAYTNTNGVRQFSESQWEDIFLPHSFIQFSIDSFNKDTYKKIRGCDVNYVVGNLKKIMNIRKNNNIAMGSNFVIMTHNVHEMFDFVQMSFEEFHVDGVFFNHVGGMDSLSVFNDAYLSEIYHENCLKIKETFKGMNVRGLGD